MTVQACIIIDQTTAQAAEALNDDSAAVGGDGVWCRQIDNPLSNTLVGLGDRTGNIFGLYYLTARVFIDPLYATFVPVLSGQPIYTLDSEYLFLPQTEV